MQRADYRSQDADIDIGRLFAALWRTRYRIAVAAILFTGLVFLALSYATPEYTSDSRILIESSESIFTRPGGEQAQTQDAAFLDPEGVTSQVQILKSSDLLKQVADQLSLEKNSEFNPTAKMSSLKSGLVALGLMEDPALVSSEKRVLDNILKRLDVYPVENSRVIVISFSSRDPEMAARFANALAQAYLDLETKSQLDTTGKAASYLADEIAGLQKSIQKAEAAVADYRASSGLLVGQNNSVLATQQLAELTTELSRVRAERSSAEARARSVQSALDSGASLDSIPEVVQSALIGRLREREIALNAQIAELSTSLLPGHPRIRALKSQLEDLSRQIRAEAKKIMVGLKNQADIARARENELNANLNELKAASANANGQEVELRALEREAASQRALLESYMGRYREARSRDEGKYAPAKARLISRAVVPAEPVFPKILPMMGAAFFVSILLMVLATLLRELLSGRAFVPAAGFASGGPDTEFADDAQALAARREEPSMRPEFVSAPSYREDETVAAAEAPANDNYGIDKLAIKLVESGASRAIVVSPEGDVAASASVELARMLANEGLRTILVDLTGSGAATRRMLEDKDCPGITDLLSASSSYSDVIYPDYATEAHIIPTGLADPRRAMRAADRLPIILDALVSAYDMVVVECGSTDADGVRRLMGPDSRIVLSVMDPAAPEIVRTAENLVDSGIDDLLLVTADVDGGAAPDPRPRRAYAR